MRFAVRQVTGLRMMFPMGVLPRKIRYQEEGMQNVPNNVAKDGRFGKTTVAAFMGQYPPPRHRTTLNKPVSIPRQEPRQSSSGSGSGTRCIRCCWQIEPSKVSQCEDNSTVSSDQRKRASIGATEAMFRNGLSKFRDGREVFFVQSCEWRYGVLFLLLP